MTMVKVKKKKRPGTPGTRGMKKRGPAKSRAQSRSPSLSVNLAGLRLKNPVMTASGTFGYGLEFAPYMDLSSIGAVITKGLSLEPRQGNPPPRIVETPCGMLNAIGLANVGVEAFISQKLPLLKKHKTRIIANIFGETVKEYAEVARALDNAEGVDAIEINISCPNVKKGGLAFGTEPKEAARVVSAVRKATRLHVMTKLTPNVTDIRVMARAVVEAGSDSISLINTIPAMAVDAETMRPVLSIVTGGLSGPAIKPVALKLVHDAASVVKAPIIGIGGIVIGTDAVEFMLAGASAVQVGTASFISPGASAGVVSGIEEYLKRHKIRRASAIVGRLKKV